MHLRMLLKKYPCSYPDTTRTSSGTQVFLRSRRQRPHPYKSIPFSVYVSTSAGVGQNDNPFDKSELSASVNVQLDKLTTIWRPSV